MKQSIIPGGSIEVATADELRELLHDELAAVSRRRERGASAAKSDANGNLAPLDLFTVPLGMEFELNRLLVTADGISPAVKFSAAGASALLVKRSGRVIDFWGSAKAVAGNLNLPASIEYTSAVAPILRNGETLQVEIVGSPAGALASVQVLVDFQGRLMALAEE